MNLRSAQWERIHTYYCKPGQLPTAIEEHSTATQPPKYNLTLSTIFIPIDECIFQPSPKKLLFAIETTIKIPNSSNAENKSVGYPTPTDASAVESLYLSGNIVKEGLGRF